MFSAIRFRANWRGNDIIEQVFSPGDDDGGGGSYDVLKVWELQLMLRLTAGDEEKYSMIPVGDRARLICAEHLSDWVSALDAKERFRSMSEQREQVHHASNSQEQGQAPNV